MWKVELAIGFITTILEVSSVVSLRVYLHSRYNKIGIIVKLRSKNRSIIGSRY